MFIIWMIMTCPVWEKMCWHTTCMMSYKYRCWHEKKMRNKSKLMKNSKHTHTPRHLLSRSHCFEGRKRKAWISPFRYNYIYHYFMTTRWTTVKFWPLLIQYRSNHCFYRIVQKSTTVGTKIQKKSYVFLLGYTGNILTSGRCKIS